MNDVATSKSERHQLLLRPQQINFFRDDNNAAKRTNTAPLSLYAALAPFEDVEDGVARLANFLGDDVSGVHLLESVEDGVSRLRDLLDHDISDYNCEDDDDDDADDDDDEDDDYDKHYEGISIHGEEEDEDEEKEIIKEC